MNDQFENFAQACEAFGRPDIAECLRDSAAAETRAAAELEALRADSRRWKHARTRIMWGRWGPSLPAGATRVDASETDAAIDQAIADGEGS